MSDEDSLVKALLERKYGDFITYPAGIYTNKLRELFHTKYPILPFTKDMEKLAQISRLNKPAEVK